MNTNDYQNQGNYYPALYQIFQWTNRQLWEERQNQPPRPSLLRRLYNALDNRLRPSGQAPAPRRTSLRPS